MDHYKPHKLLADEATVLYSAILYIATDASSSVSK